MHVHDRPKLSESGEFLGKERLWTLFKAIEKRYSRPILILDTDGIVNPANLNLALTIEDDPETIEEWLEEVPYHVKKKIKRLLLKYGYTEEDLKEDLAQCLAGSYILYRPIPKLKSKAILNEIDWKTFIDELVEWKCTLDPRFKLIRKATILRGVKPKYNPNSLQFTNGGTGKSDFYRKVGLLIDKATAKSFLGYAKSPDEIYPGIIEGMEKPIGIDQIESQSAPQIMRYLFNIMEFGSALVSSGAAKFKVESKSSFHILGNPIGYETDPAKSFSRLMAHISYNPAIGRRFGLIVYGTDFKRIEKKDEDFENWKKAIALFRAVEEAAAKQLQRIFNDKKVFTWLNKEIPNYAENVRQIVSEIKDENIRTFLIEHAEGGQHRVKAAALNIAIVENLDKIALEKYSIDELLEEAEIHLHKIIELNIKSISNIAKSYELEKQQLIRLYFENLPDYMKEIVSAIELMKKELDQPTEIPLMNIPYQPSNENYSHFSKCIDRLKRRKNIETLNNKLREYFGFELKRKNGIIIADIITLEPCNHIQPLGKLTQTLKDFSRSQISQFLNIHRDKVSEKLSKMERQTQKNSLYKHGEIEKTEKKRTLLEYIKHNLPTQKTLLEHMNENNIPMEFLAELIRGNKIVETLTTDGEIRFVPYYLKGGVDGYA